VAGCLKETRTDWRAELRHGHVKDRLLGGCEDRPRERTTTGHEEGVDVAERDQHGFGGRSERNQLFAPQQARGVLRRALPHLHGVVRLLAQRLRQPSGIAGNEDVLGRAALQGIRHRRPAPRRGRETGMQQQCVCRNTAGPEGKIRASPFARSQLDVFCRHSADSTAEMEVDPEGLAMASHGLVHRGRCAGQKALARLDQVHRELRARAVAAQDLSQRLHAFQPSPHNYEGYRPRPAQDLLQSCSDGTAVGHRLERHGPACGAGHPEGVVAAPDSDDADVEADAPPVFEEEPIRAGFDAFHASVNEAVPGGLNQATPRQPQTLGVLHTGD